MLKKGDISDIRHLFWFNKQNTAQQVMVKFNLFGRFFFPNFFKSNDAPFHKDIDLYNYQTYSANLKYFVNIAFRGSAKSTRTKLFLVFAIANDRDHFRKYIKILTKDINNSKQFVTDTYNMFISPKMKLYYPEIFQKTDLKREETMSAYTTFVGVKVKAGTVGTDQRGALQGEEESSRPDWIIADDFETRKTLRSAIETQSIHQNMEEARTSLSIDGGMVYLCNYLSERGNVHLLAIKKSENTKVLITPIKDKDNKPTWPSAYTIEQINQIENDADDFSGEYMCEPSAGHDVLFDRDSLNKQTSKQPIKTIADFKIFYSFDPSHRYGSGHDIAGGVGLDSSTSVFIDFSTLPARVVATFKSNTIKPDTFGDEIEREACLFGKPIVAPENNNHGHATIGRLKQIYDNIYYEEIEETRVGLPPKTRRFGFNTNAASKPKILFDLKKAVEDGLLELSDEDLINELKAYTRNDLLDPDIDPRLTTRHWDLLMAAAIGFNLKNFAEVTEKKVEYNQLDEYETNSF